MKETLICSLEKHNIYYLSDANVSFYILVPYKEYDNTNISIISLSFSRYYPISIALTEFNCFSIIQFIKK